MIAQDEVRMLTDKLESGNLKSDEPLFTLRGRDRLAYRTVSYWITLAEVAGVPTAKIEEAKDLLDKMRVWEPTRVPGRPETEGSD